MNKKNVTGGISLLGLLAIGVVISGCSAQGPLGEDFGNSVRMAKASQTLNPNPENLEELVVGVDGVAVKHTRDAYQKSFEVKEEEKPVAVFSFGGK
jgi:hypothetical protein